MKDDEGRAERRVSALATARKAYGHISGLDDIDRLCLMLSRVEHHKQERLEALNANAAQAAKIASLERALNG